MRDLRGQTHPAPPPAPAMADGRWQTNEANWSIGVGIERISRVIGFDFVDLLQTNQALLLARVDLKQRSQGSLDPFGAGEDDKNK